MDQKQTAKMESMKKQNQIKIQEQELLKNALYQECIAALSDYVVIQDDENITALVKSGEIEMHKHSENVRLIDNERYYIVWDNISVPVIESSGKCINNNWNDVMAVAFDTYFVMKSSGKIIGIRN